MECQKKQTRLLDHFVKIANNCIQSNPPPELKVSQNSFTVRYPHSFRQAAVLPYFLSAVECHFQQFLQRIDQTTPIFTTHKQVIFQSR